MTTTHDPAADLRRLKLEGEAKTLDNLLRAEGLDPARVRFPAPPVCTLSWTPADWCRFIVAAQPQPAAR